MNEQKIRVRFAPSPTGALHLGGARTAIYNWLFAQVNNGDFLLRIEDTDQKRSKPELVEQITNSMKWLGLNWNEELVFQSNRTEIYKKYINQLVQSKNAYYCFCHDKDDKCNCNFSMKEISDKISKNGKFTIKFKIPEGKTFWKDKVYGQIEVDNKEIEDFIILRSDRTPTYQLAVVVDDLEMAISHVIRGEDHLSNTPKQIQIFKALGVKPPTYAHLPLLFGEDEKRLSKRHGATGVDEYREMGYPSVVVFNYLSLLGWSPKNNQEIMNVKSIIKQFTLKNISKKAAIFDTNKLDWISGKHIKQMEIEDIVELIYNDFQELGFLEKISEDCEKEYIVKIVKLLKNRVKTLKDFSVWGRYFFFLPEKYDNDAVLKNWQVNSVNELMENLIKDLNQIENWNKNIIEKSVRNLSNKMKINAGAIIHPFRLAITGYGVSPDIFEITEMLGQKEVVYRIKKAIENLSIL